MDGPSGQSQARQGKGSRARRRVLLHLCSPSTYPLLLLLSSFSSLPSFLPPLLSFLHGAHYFIRNISAVVLDLLACCLRPVARCPLSFAFCPLLSMSYASISYPAHFIKQNTQGLSFPLSLSLSLSHSFFLNLLVLLSLSHTHIHFQSMNIFWFCGGSGGKVDRQMRDAETNTLKEGE